jgi:NDP-sugar pyrophosphorylase family protein
MRAVILAGGKGVRLAPLTEVIPKPLVPLGGMPILEIVIRQLKAHGFKQITLAVGYLSELIRTYFQDGAKWGIEIEYSYEAQPLGTAGPLALIDGLTETFLVMNADVLTNLNFNELLQFHRHQGALATVGAFERQVKIDLGVIIKDGDSRVRDYVEKPTRRFLASMGVYVFEPQVLEQLHPDFQTAGPDLQSPVQAPGYLDFPDLVKRLLRQNLPVCYFPFRGYWLDIGRHEDYARASEEFLQIKQTLSI